MNHFVCARPRNLLHFVELFVEFPRFVSCLIGCLKRKSNDWLFCGMFFAEIWTLHAIFGFVEEKWRRTCMALCSFTCFAFVTPG